MNTTRLFTVLFVALLTTVAQAQTKISDKASAVQQAVTLFFDGLSAGDTKAMRQHLTGDFLLLEGGAIWNIDTLEAKIAPYKGTDFHRTNHLRFIATDVNGKTAWAAYHNTADFVINGQSMSVRWLESAVLLKTAAGWRIRMLHSTPVKD